MEKIDLSQYRLTGAGANGESYDSLTDASEMVKLYNTDYPVGPIVEELEVARKVYDLGIPSPKPGELVTDGSRTGIRFRRIAGKRSYARMISQETERIPEFAADFARWCKVFHNTPAPEGMFPDAKRQFLHMLEVSRTFDAAQKAVIESFIRSIPDSGTMLHGDMHVGNVISTLPFGAPMDTPHETLFIDLGYASSGFPLLDIGMMMSVCLISDEEFRQKEMHFDAAQGRQVWDAFAKEYFFSDDRLAEKYFGPGQTMQTVWEALRPYTCVKLLLVEYNLGSMPDRHRNFIFETFGF